MSEELLQRDLIKNPGKIGTWNFYNIGATSINTLKEAGIIRSIDYGHVSRKKVDAIITRQKEVIAIVEYKSPKQFNTQKKKNRAILQEIEVAKKLQTKLIIITDTQETIWINVATNNRVKDRNGNNLNYLFDPRDQNLQKIIEEIVQSINDKNDYIRRKELIDPTNLAKQVWQDVWSVSGATPENCLYTFVELFIFKYLSDLNVLTGTYSFKNIMKMYKENDPNTVLKHYADIVRKKIKSIFPENTIDKTTIINGTIFVSKDQEAVDGYGIIFKRVLERFEKYEKLENIDYDFKSKLFESFLKESISKKNWGQFFTPIKVVRAIIEMAKEELKEGMTICDPACGVGKFLLEFIKNDLNKFFKIENGQIIQKIKIVGFDKGFDKDEQKTIILAKANMLIYFCDLVKDNTGITKEFSKLFNDSFILKTNSILGTLSDTIENKYDLILTNPPYVTSGSSNLKEEIAKKTVLKNHYKINAMGIEGLFIEWIIRALKPNGKAFIIVPDGILNRKNDKNLRQFVLDTCFIDAIISLPVKTFFTTPKKTYVLAITKKDNMTQNQTDPVFTYLCSEIGESRDVYRFDIEQDDLKEAVNLFNAFKGSKKHFSTLNNDKRCKIQSIENFKAEENWSIDRWFTKEEKIDLGIENENKSVCIDEFSDVLNDVGQMFSEFSLALKNVNSNNNNEELYKEVFLKEKQFFDLFIGKRILKKEIVNINDKNIPVYSANVFKPIGFTKISNIDNFDNNFVIWGIDGGFNFNYIRKGQIFCTTDHCGSIRILNDDIFPEYLMIELERVKSAYGFDRGLRSSLKNMQNISIKIPVNKHGIIDIRRQQDIIKKYHAVLEIKNKINEYRRNIYDIHITIDLNKIDYFI